MPASAPERVRASKLRARIANGKPVKPGDRAWLRAYEANTARAKARAEARRNLPGALAGEFRTAPEVTSVPAPVVAGPQLEMVHVTTPPDGVDDPGAAQWSPSVPAPTAGAEPPAPGAPPAPNAGEPIIGEVVPDAPVGDPVAAKQFAALVTFIANVGYSSSLELIDGVPLPDEWRLLAQSSQGRMTVLRGVAASAERLAMKLGLRALPMSDEAVVLGAVGGSAVAFLAARRKRRRAGRAETAPAAASAPASTATEPTSSPPWTPENTPPALPPAGLAGLWPA